MPTAASNTKRIAKNTLVLYVRMIVVLVLALYTSRIVLKALGIDDFGLYNVVGGVVGLLTFFNGTMLKASQRFLNVAMVKGEKTLDSIFASCITIHLLFAGLFFLLGETIGLWFLNTHINIPAGRELAASMVYHATVVSFCVSIVSIPYSAVVVAYERMTFLAVVSIIDAVLKLGIAFLLLYSSADRLSLYGLLFMCVQVLNFILYYVYCKQRHSQLKFRISLNRDNFKQIFSFVSWTLVGQLSVIVCNQGNIVLVNLFHPLVANAAMSVGNQINNAIAQLTTNFQTAFNPQITKSYAEGNHDYLRTLVYTTSKMSFCIMFVVALPIAFNIDWLLSLWLSEVPSLSNSFAILFMVCGIINAVSMPFNFTVLSSDKIKYFQIATAIVFFLDIPIAYLLFCQGMSATTVLWVKMVVITAMLFVRIFYASRLVDAISLWTVCKLVLAPLILTSAVTVCLAFLLNAFSYTLALRFLYTFVIEIVCVVMMWWLCFSEKERTALTKMLPIDKVSKILKR